MSDPGAAFRALHRPGDPFILANVWDAGTARLMAGLGAEALATASAAHAFTLGAPDGGNVTRDEALAHAGDIVRATALPVSGDLENGYGRAPEEAARTVRQAAVAGLAGCSIEDTDLPGRGAYPFAETVARIEAAVEAARALPADFVLCARADGMVTGAYGEEEATRRLKAFVDAGADCVYAPGVRDMETVSRLAAAVEAPLNVLVIGPLTAVPRSEFARAGVARLSLGPALIRRALAPVIEAGEAMFGRGDFGVLGAGASGGDIDALLRIGGAE
ncbi:MAG: isocitrate lyase/phosphoenolpyruvate mutase family protein [Pseudomonadota bacterium]